MAVRRRRRPHQRILWDTAVLTERAATTYVGHFFEELAAKVLKAERVTVEGSVDLWNPDLITQSGAEVEVKASARNSWMLDETQLDGMTTSKDALVALIRYTKGPVSLWDVDRLSKLYALLAEDEVRIWLLPAALVGACKGLMPGRSTWYGTREIRTLSLKLVEAWFAGSKRRREALPVGLATCLKGRRRERVVEKIECCGEIIPAVRIYSGLRWVPLEGADAPPF
jgi:hypothetical protein